MRLKSTAFLMNVTRLSPPLSAKIAPPPPTQPLFVAKNGPPLAKSGPIRTKFGNQNQSRGPLLAAESGPPDQFGLLQMLLLPHSDC